MNQSNNLIQKKKEDTKVLVNHAGNSAGKSTGIYLADNRSKNAIQKKENDTGLPGKAHAMGCGCGACAGQRAETVQTRTLNDNAVIQRQICPGCGNDTLRNNAVPGEVCPSCTKGKNKTKNTRKESGMGKGGEDKRKGRHHRG